MKKNFKVLSSLALAGMLTTSVMGTSLAITKDVTSVTPGVCSQIIAGTKNVVPFVLANKDDIITIKDIKDSGKFNMTKFKGLSVPDESTQVRTGDTFTSNGKDYTVVIYGDVDKNGTVNVLDALEIAKYGRKLASKLDGDATATELANVQRADQSGVNILDALRIQRFVLGQEPSLVDKLPDADVVEEYPYTLSVNDGYINSENVDATTVKIKAENTSEKLRKLTAKVSDANGENQAITGLTTVEHSITAHNDYVEISSLDFSGLVEGSITIQLLDENKKVVGEVATEKNTVRPAAALVRTNRTASSDVKMSLSAMGNSDIVKMYYVVVKSTASVSWDNVNSKFTVADADLITENTINVSGNKLEDALISDALTKNETYKVYYMLENTYGSRLATAGSADVLSDIVKNQVSKVEKITLGKDTTTYSWDKVDDATGYIVTEYKDGKIVKEDNTLDADTTTYTVAENGDGKYKISVIAKGSATLKDSEATLSEEVEVKSLKAVTDVTFEVAGGKAMLSWKDANAVADVEEYQIKLYQLNENGTYKTTPVVTTAANDTKIDLSSDLTDGTVYKAEVIAVKATGKVKLTNSKGSTLEGICVIEPNATVIAEKTTENSVTLNATEVKVNGKSANYQVKVYTVRKDANKEEPEYKFIAPIKNVDYDKNSNEITIAGLASDTKYVFKLIANVNGIQGESDYIGEPGVTTKKATPEIKNLTVITDKTKVAKGNACYDATNEKVYLNGEEYAVDSAANYANKFKNMAALIGSLHDGDKITVNGETITLTLPSQASDAATATDKVDFKTYAKDMTIEIENNGFDKTIVATAGSEPKQVTLKGQNARFTVEGLNAKKIVLTNGVIVTGDNQYTVSAGATVTINGVKVTTTQETIIDSTENDKTLNVTANTKDNNLVFENVTSSNVTVKDAVINFVGLGDNTSKQSGTIKIKTTGGKVTVQQEKVNVASKLIVEVNTGDVEIQDEAFTGVKDFDITVTKKDESDATSKATVKAISKTQAPEKLQGADAIELKEYTEEEKATLKTKLDCSDIELDKILEYMSSFKINGKGAWLTVATPVAGETVSKVTIEFKEAVENINISNIY